MKASLMAQMANNHLQQRRLGSNLGYEYLWKGLAAYSVAPLGIHEQRSLGVIVHRSQKPDATEQLTHTHRVPYYINMTINSYCTIN